MSESEEKVTPILPARRLAEAIREVKNAAADQGDVVVEMREAARHRLELLANELAAVFDEVPADEPYFDFAISSGLQPRLWIDAVAHVSMGRDRRTYRFVRDTRLGPIVLAESSNTEPVADQVTKYIAERMVEREKLLDGDVEHVRALAAANSTESEAVASATDTSSGIDEPVNTDSEEEGHPVREFFAGFLLVVLGMLLAAGILAVIYRERLPALGINL